MNWRNIQTVWARELRDQLRDRRTLFMVAVLPLMMYPIMGMSLTQLVQFMQGHKATVEVFGAEQLTAIEGLPPLLSEEGFANELFDLPTQANKLLVEIQPGESHGPRLNAARRRLAEGKLDAVVVFPPDFAARLAELRNELEALGSGEKPLDSTLAMPKAAVLHNSTRDASQVAHLRVERLLAKWREQIVGKNLDETRVPVGALQPFNVRSEDVAPPDALRSGVWAKFLPFFVFLWALTGAFYPAVDVCAGEKERGTLETLLASPAGRGDIVWGKLLTVTTFSMLTAVLNLLGIGLLGHFVTAQFAGALGSGLGMPPLVSLIWLLVALPPVAALFSALSFACASFARSTKEGQYYFMPLFLATMPLMLMPLSPGVELNLGNSLAPVMGLALLLRSLMEGDFFEAVRYALPVTIVTFGCCLLAIRWAVSQFNQESVLFRGGERFDLRLWLASLSRRQHATPTVSMAVGCFALILLLQFVARSVQPSFLPPPDQIEFKHLVALLLVSQACVLLPAILIGGLLTTDPRRTFLLGTSQATGQPPSRQMVLAILAAGLAVAVHPLGIQLSEWIRQLYPLSDEMLAQAGALSGLATQASSPFVVVLILGLLPAVVEEFTFRGCILSGLRSSGSTGWAVVISAVAFGAIHGVFQQSLSAACLGLLIGYLAVVTRSLAPCIAFHAVYNSLPALIAYYAKPLSRWLESSRWAGNLVRIEGQQLVGYQPTVILAATAAAGLLLWGVHRRAPGATTAERATYGAPGSLPSTSIGVGAPP